MEETQGSSSFNGAFKEFMQQAANYITVFTPILSKLSEMLRV